ncbi:ABC transporter ATP-binding protein [Methyloraptor flagellatus]|uniref:Spermidine/putrescine import ATP-binding protein PotA n=1 Tax=Methyloraptor flagellatus TaxID=3162530 RepID=A0AAU7X890_9HYPH
MTETAIGSVRRTFAPWADPSAKPLIRFENVTKRFGHFVAIDNLTLDIYEREFFALLGPSGCGKTTLMRMLAGFETPNTGRILLAGEDIARLPPWKRPVNMMFQSYALFPHLTVEANIAFGLKQDGMPKADIQARVAEMLKLVRLEALAKRKPDQLSGGQRQRVALARALAKRPKVLLLDEPLGALDKKLREATQFELMDLQVELGMTFLIVTHDQEEAMTLADRIAVMDQGRVVQVDTPGMIYEEPNTRYVADFVGDINIFDGKVAGIEGDWVRVGIEGRDLPLLVRSNRACTVGQAVSIAVRPEKTRISRTEPLGQPNVIPATVWDIAYLGDWTDYVARTADKRRIKASTANVTRTVDTPLTWEDPVFVSFAPDGAVLLTG